MQKDHASNEKLERFCATKKVRFEDEGVRKLVGKEAYEGAEVARAKLGA
jgi:hypothetical protein